MAHGGKRPGSGRKKGSVGRKRKVRSARLLAHGDLPIDIMLTSARELLKAREFAAAAAAAAKVAPYIHQKFTVTQEPAQKHRDQKVQGELSLVPPQPEGEEAPDSWAGILN